MEKKLTEVMQAKRIQRWITRPNHQLVVGVVTPSDRYIWVNGNVANEDRLPDAIYEIGSISKTFIGLLLAIGEEKGLWKSSDSLADIVPEWASSSFAQQTTLLQLVTHTAGLPRLPNNIEQTVNNKLDPYANYSEQDMTEAILSEQPRENRSFNYSNYGFGLLGLSFAKRLGKSLHDIMTEMVFEPLQMDDSGFTINATERRIPVYNSKGTPTPHWQFQDSTAGAGGISSTVTDMLHYLEAHLGLRGQHIADALARSHKEYYAIRPNKGVGIGYSWLRYKENDGSVTHWHNGGTYGSSSFASFNRDHSIGLIILSNYGPNLRSSIPLIGASKLNVDKIAQLLNEAMLT